MDEIKPRDFAKSFGVEEAALSKNTLEKISAHDFNYHLITGEELEELLLDILKKIDGDKQIIAGDGRQQVWLDGWQENLDEYLSDDNKEKIVVPKFIRSGVPVRWFRNYIQPTNPKFEYAYIDVLRQHVFERYFSGVDNLYEFGSGTGHNLVAASEILGNLGLVGLDFVQPSVDLISRIGDDHGIDLKGQLFDMSNPDFNFQLETNSAVLTFGALEQLASKIEPMMSYLLSQKPKICVHIEPAVETYDLSKLSDYLAFKFQSQRGYSSGLITLLDNFEREKRIKIHQIKRLEFGSLMMEGYNLMVWSAL